MTAPARITQADIDRATKAVKTAGFERARIVMDLAKAKIEIIIGEAANESPPPAEWSDDDLSPDDYTVECPRCLGDGCVAHDLNEDCDDDD